MEKQGMDWRIRSIRAGLLIFFTVSLLIVSFFQSGAIWADEGDALELLIETSPADPVVGSPWSLYILVKYPHPREVNVEPPRFPSTLALERVRAGVRIDAQGERWTQVEFLFNPVRVDAITLEPFEVKTPNRRSLTPPLRVSIKEDTIRRRYNPAFRWVDRTPSIPKGEMGKLVLELVNWDPLKKVPSGFFQGKAPVNAILEESPPSRQEEGVYRYNISVIPLDSSAVKLPRVLFNSDIYSLSIPEITISILPAKVIPASPLKVDEVIQDEAAIIKEDFIQMPYFPDSRENVFFLIRRDYRQNIARAIILWDEERYAESLAELRKSERNSLSGPYLISLRREIEQILGIGLTENENWRPLRISLPIWGVLGFIILLAGAFLFDLQRQKVNKKRNINFRLGNGFLTIVVTLLVVTLAFIFLEESIGSILVGRPGSTGKTAILKETFGYRIPDPKGAVSDQFFEGQPVIVSDYRGGWCFAETPDGRSGWVPRTSVILY
jgi:hypothetical protein